MNLHRLLLPTAAALTLFAACDKDDTVAPVTAEERASARVAIEEALVASTGFATAFATVSGEAQRNDDLGGLIASNPDPESASALAPRNCGTVDFTSTDDVFFPATLTLDFGAGCTNEFDQRVGGSLRTTFSGLFHEPGTTITLELVDYVVAGNAISGDYAITNTGFDDLGRPTFRHSITGGRVAFTDGKTLRYDEVVTSVVAEGSDTNFWNAGLDGLLDDVHADVRTATLVTTSGNTFSLTTPDALRRPVTCGRPVSGKYALSSPVLAETAELDFGQGACDDIAEVTYGGESWKVRF